MQFMEQQDKPDYEGHKLEIIRLLPSFVMGPILFKTEGSSVGHISQILTGKIPGLVDLNMILVDVRDVAEAHYLALTKDNIHGGRFALSEQPMKI